VLRHGHVQDVVGRGDAHRGEAVGLGDRRLEPFARLLEGLLVGHDLRGVEVGAEGPGELLEAVEHLLDGLVCDRADHGRELRDLLARLLDTVLEAAVRLLGGPVAADDEVGLEGRGLLGVDLAPRLADDLDAVEVEALQRLGVLQGLAEEDADGPDAVRDERRGGLALRDDPRRHLLGRVRLAVAGGVRPGVLARRLSALGAEATAGQQECCRGGQQGEAGAQGHGTSSRRP
jgi:hypothetical protein